MKIGTGIAEILMKEKIMAETGSRIPDFALRTFKGMDEGVRTNINLSAKEIYNLENAKKLTPKRPNEDISGKLSLEKPKQCPFSEKLMAALPRLKRETQARIDARAKEIAELEDPKALQARIQALRFEQAVDKRHLEAINADLNNLNVIA